MDFKRLRYFVTVAEERHITRAAERLGIQQPPLSQQIQALEAELETRLFHRTRRGVELTEVGEALFEDATRILRDVERARARVRRTARGEVGRVVVGFTSSTPFHPLFAQIMRDYRAQFPDVALELKDDGSAELLDLLAEDQVDVAFIRTEALKREGIAMYPLSEEGMRLALPTGHPLAKAEGDEVPLKALSGEPFILYRKEAGAGLYNAIMQACAAEGFAPEIVQEAPWVGATLHFVAAGMGVSLVPSSLARMTRLDRVVYRRITGKAKLAAPIMLACRRSDPSPTTSALIAMARGAAKAWREEDQNA